MHKRCSDVIRELVIIECVKGSDFEWRQRVVKNVLMRLLSEDALDRSLLLAPYLIHPVC